MLGSPCHSIQYFLARFFGTTRELGCVVGVLPADGLASGLRLITLADAGFSLFLGLSDLLGDALYLCTARPSPLFLVSISAQF